MPGKTIWQREMRRGMQGLRRCRSLTNLALVLAAQLPASEQASAYRQISRTLRDHIGQPRDAVVAMARLLTDNSTRAA